MKASEFQPGVKFQIPKKESYNYALRESCGGSLFVDCFHKSDPNRRDTTHIITEKKTGFLFLAFAGTVPLKSKLIKFSDLTLITE